MPVAVSRVCPVLIGRVEELAALKGAAAEAAAGRASVALISGEAGAGKSRLLLGLLPAALDLRFQQLAGGCSERDPEFPLAPFVDALRQRLSELGDPRVFLEPQGEPLAEILPELRHWYRGRSGPQLAPEQGKRRLFEALVALFGRLAAERPLLLILEDLHWADPTTLELLELLPRRLRVARLLIVATARTDEPSAELRACLNSLRRSRTLLEVQLDLLSRAEVAEMLEALLGVVPPTSLSDAVDDRTEGNPFFIEELLAASPETPSRGILEAGVPETVRDAVVRRAEELDHPQRPVLEAVAVTGRAVEPRVLHETTDLSEDELGEALSALVQRGLLVANGAAYGFRHALAREAIYGEIPPGRRRILHERVAHADLLADAVAVDQLESALALARRIGSEQWAERLEAWIARCEVRLGRRDPDDPVLRSRPGGRPTTIGQRRSLYSLAELELTRGNAGRALELVDQLLQGASGPRPAAAVLLRAQALAASGASEEADTALLDARPLWALPADA